MIFANPAELIAFYDENFRLGRYKIYPWQYQILKSFSRDLSGEDMVRIALIAANGSGKSQFALAPCAVWHAVNFPASQTVVTTASGQQLDKQSGRFIKQLAAKINLMHRQEFGGNDVWKINYRQLIYNPDHDQRSYIDLFATDEAGQAEGWHPIVPGGSFAIFVDEVKSIGEDIYEALSRCNGCTRRVDISSPGACCGHFYDVCTRPELLWEVYKVTAYDCPHIKKREIDQVILKHGPNDPLVRSSIFAEFTSADESIILLPETVNKCVREFAQRGMRKEFGQRRAGLDLSGGGDETVLSVWQGNLQLGQECFRFRDAVPRVAHIIELFKKWHLDPGNVWADDGGLGRGDLDHLAGAGWRVNRVLNGNPPTDRTRYVNRGTEMWFNFKRFVEDGDAGLLDDSTLKIQLSTRYYVRQTGSSKLRLESKDEARKKGRPSPDRADAAVLAWADVSYPLGGKSTTNLPDTRCPIGELEHKIRREASNVFFPEKQSEIKSLDRLRQRELINNLIKNSRRGDDLWKLLKKK